MGEVKITFGRNHQTQSSRGIRETRMSEDKRSLNRRNTHINSQRRTNVHTTFHQLFLPIFHPFRQLGIASMRNRNSQHRLQQRQLRQRRQITIAGSQYFLTMRNKNRLYQSHHVAIVRWFSLQFTNLLGTRHLRRCQSMKTSNSKRLSNRAFDRTKRTQVLATYRWTK